jgi:hypothetical protein
MADLDLSEILEDSDLASTFSVIRRAEAVGATGRATFTEAQTDGVIGVVTAGDPGKLLRKDDGQMTDNVITVSTSYKLRASGDNIQADVILFLGIRYTVSALKRWPQMGTGFVKAVAVSENASDPAL